MDKQHRAATQGHPPAQNAFDFIRVMAALAVLYSHSFTLYGLPEPLLMAGQTVGSVAVAVFFSLSGFLICQSWQRDPSVRRFALRRMLRIFPGLITVVLLTVLIVGPLMTHRPLREYFADASPWHYLWNAGLALGSPPITGLFATNPYPDAVNGSLWTLRYEILMYTVLAGAGRLFLKAPLKPVCIGVFASFALMWCFLTWHVQQLVPVPFVWRLDTEFYFNRIAYLGAFFFAGAVANLYRSKMTLSWIVAAVMLVPAFLLGSSANMVLLWFAIPYCVLVFAFKAPAVFRKVSGYDYSYGIYIYAFPVQQIISELGVRYGLPWIGALAASTAATVVLAGLSWHLVEKPALSFKDRIGAFGRQPQLVSGH